MAIDAESMDLDESKRAERSSGKFPKTPQHASMFSSSKGSEKDSKKQSKDDTEDEDESSTYDQVMSVIEQSAPLKYVVLTAPVC